MSCRWAFGGCRNFEPPGVNPVITRMFTIPANIFLATGGNARSYDVATDDDRFLMVRAYGSVESSSSLILVQNFFEELKRVVPN